MHWLHLVMTRAATDQGRRDLALSQLVFGSRWRLLALALLVLPVLASPAIGDASGIPEALGGKQRYGPSPFSPDMLLVTIGIGLVAGLISGSTGAGGGFVITPALMSLGIKGILAVGTDMLYLFASGLVGTTVHRRLGNVNVRLAATFTIGSITGVTLGGMANRALYALSPIVSDLVISLSYAIILGFLGFYALADFLRSRRLATPEGASDTGPTSLARAAQSVRLPPYIRFDDHLSSGRRVSAVFVVLCGLFVGFVAAILGAGGGFITFPVFVYGLGISTLTTTGTNILQVVFTSGYGAITQYAVHGYAIYSLAIGMLLGSLVGVQIGAVVTKCVPPAYIRAFYAVAILAGFVNRLFALPDDLSRLGVIALEPAVVRLIADVGAGLFFALVTLLAVWVIGSFALNTRRLRARSSADAPGSSGSGLVRNRRSLVLGLALLGSFYATVAALLLAPVFPEAQTGLRWADGLFNSVSKGSANFLPEEAETARTLSGQPVRVTLRASDAEQARTWAGLYGTTGAGVALAGNDVTVAGDLGSILSNAVADSRIAYADAGASDAFETRYHLPTRAVTYGWWTSFQALDRALTTQGQPTQAAAVRSVSRRALEPAHNYLGVERRTSAESVGPLVGVLALYLLFTAWYGSAVFALSTAFGIGVGKSARPRTKIPDPEPVPSH